MCRQQQQWVVQHMEGRQALPPPARLALLQQLVATDAFERFLALKFPGTKVTAGNRLD